jgi:hypothetical protein
MREAPVDRRLDGAKHGVPRRVKRHGDFLPAQPLGPASQKPNVRLGHALFAICPRHSFDDHAATRAVDPSHRVHQVHQDAPERHKREAAGLQRVVARPLLEALGATPSTSPVGPDLHRERELAAFAAQLGLPIYEAALAVNAIEDSLELHP